MTPSATGTLDEPLAPQRLMVAIASWALLVLVFTSNLLPIGEVFGIPFRTILFLIVLASTFWLVVFTRGPELAGAAAFSAAFFAMILLAALNGLVSGQTPDTFVLGDLRTYVVTFSIPILALLQIELRAVSARSIARAFVWGTLVYATLKMIAFWILVFLPDIARLLLFVLLNDSRASVVFGFVAPGVSRIQTGLDFSATISLVILLVDRAKVIMERGRSVAMAILIFAVIVTFSRTLVALLILVLVSYLTFAATRRARIAGGVVMSAGLALTVLLGADALQNRLETGQKGDETRKPQAEALLDLWEKAPLLGRGLGAFNPVVTRDKMAPYNYELQLHSIASKLGLAGIVLLMVLTIFAFAATVGTVPAGLVAWPVGMFVAFLAAASTNPYMFSSAAANVYIALFIGFRAFEKPVERNSTMSAGGQKI